MTSAQDIQGITDVLMLMIGKLVLSVYLDRDKDLCLSFTKEEDYPEESVKPTLESTWHLWVHGSAWCIENEQEVLVASSDEVEKRDQMIEVLDNKPLLSFEVISPGFEEVLTFSDHLVLRIFPHTSEKYRHWKLRTPDMWMLNIGPGEDWSYEKIHRK